MRPVLENLGALIIDEVSMVGPDLIDCIDLSLRKVKGNDRPFGGVPIIMVGDILQLPPVPRPRYRHLHSRRSLPSGPAPALGLHHPPNPAQRLSQRPSPANRALPPRRPHPARLAPRTSWIA